MVSYTQSFILGSRSPRRLELLKQLFPQAIIEVVAPATFQEPGFAGVHQWGAIEERLIKTASGKSNDVLSLLSQRNDIAAIQSTVISADTVIVVPVANDFFTVLEQPTEDSNWKEAVRTWFNDYYFGKSHFALTAVCVDFPDGKRRESITQTKVTFDSGGQQWLDQYLETEEPRGKAGGYALQGAGSLFISKVEGSLSNVIGLPQRELLKLLQR